VHARGDEAGGDKEAVVSDFSRRDLLKAAAGAAAAAAITPSIAEAVTAGSHPDRVPEGLAARATMRGVPFERHEKVRIGIVGTGLRGRSVLSELLAIEGVQITVLCDVVGEKVARASKMCIDAGHPQPDAIVAGERGFEELVKSDDVDFVYTATPWEWHVPVMLAALKAGKHCGSECPIGTTLKISGRWWTRARSRSATASTWRTATTARRRCW
jgi:hypothetical protein